MATVHIRPGEPGRLIVQFLYSPERVAKIKSVPGRRWHSGEKYWTVSHSEGMVERLLALFAGEEVEVDPALAIGTSTQSEGWKDHPLVKRVDQELVLRGYSRRTRKNYRLQVVRFLRWLGRDPATASKAELRQYLQAMADDAHLSASYCNQAQATLKVIYELVLCQPEKTSDLPRMKEPKQLPVVLSREEVARLLKVTGNLKHKALLMLAYSAGLRVSEVVHLKASP